MHVTMVWASCCKNRMRVGGKLTGRRTCSYTRHIWCCSVSLARVFLFTSSVGVESGEGRKRRSQRTSPTSALFCGELLTPTTAKTFKPMLHQRANIQVSVREGIYSGLVLSGETEITNRSQVTKKEFDPFLPDLKPLEKLEMGEVK